MMEGTDSQYTQCCQATSYFFGVALRDGLARCKGWGLYAAKELATITETFAQACINEPGLWGAGRPVGRETSVAIPIDRLANTPRLHAQASLGHEPTIPPLQLG